VHQDPAAVCIVQPIKPRQHAEVPIEFFVVEICKPTTTQLNFLINFPTQSTRFATQYNTNINGNLQPASAREFQQ
jgi:hypothetical protein